MSQTTREEEDEEQNQESEGFSPFALTNKPRGAEAKVGMRHRAKVETDPFTV